jgi:hypothetical protein
MYELSINAYRTRDSLQANSILQDPPTLMGVEGDSPLRQEIHGNVLTRIAASNNLCLRFLNLLEVGLPVEVSGVRIQPGDLLHGDPSGVTTIPLEIADKLYPECLKVRDRETALRDSIS